MYGILPTTEALQNHHMPPSPPPPFTRRRLILALTGALGAGFCAFARAATLTAAESQPARDASLAAQWGEARQRGGGWLEWRLAAPGDWSAPSNPYDPAVADLSVEFRAPDGRQVRATAFWLKDNLATGWAVRLLPHVAGRWKATSRIRMGGGDTLAVGHDFSFDVTRVPERRRVVVDPRHPAHFAFEDGSPFVPIGLNLAWNAGAATDDYRRWFKRMAEHGGNFARIWMASWSFAIEWNDTGLGNYHARQERAAQLDRVLELAEEYGIRIMLCLVNHGAFSETTDGEWANNPYNANNGGPLGDPGEFATSARARELFARRVRYIAARWSHSPALHSWEWWNEVNWTPIDDLQLIPWIREMSQVLDRHDPYRRLRSTSWSDRGFAKAWAMPELDYAQQHDYTSADLAPFYAAQYREFRGEVPQKPLLAGELGSSGGFDPAVKRPFNWDSAHFHNGLWAPIFAGYAGTAMYWWWDLLIEPQRMWPAFKGISRFVAAVQESGRIGAYKPKPAQVANGEATAMALVSSSSALFWVRSNLYDLSALQKAYRKSAPANDTEKWTPTWTPLEGLKVQCKDIAAPDGRVTVRWLDAQSGEWLAQAPKTGTLKDGVLTVACPDFERDVAAIVDWSQRG